MAFSSANTTIIGNLTRAPEIKILANGTVMCKLGVAVNTGYWSKQKNEWVDNEPSFFNVTCWRDLAEHVAESLESGMKVICIGQMEQRSWETPEGDKRSVIEMTAEEVSPSLQRATAKVTRVATGPGAAPTKAAPVVSDVPVEEPF